MIQVLATIFLLSLCFNIHIFWHTDRSLLQQCLEQSFASPQTAGRIIALFPTVAKDVFLWTTLKCWLCP